MMNSDDAMMPSNEMNSDDAMMSGDAMEKDDTMMKNDQSDDAMMPETDTMMKESAYQDYNADAVSKAVMSGKHVALFFSASRCPTCKTLHQELNNKLSSIPSNAIIFKVDYDNSSDLKKKYGVTVQHTIVSLDAQMNMVEKKIGANANEVFAMLQ